MTMIDRAAPPTFTHELTVKATPSDVWRCLIDADAITRWFALSARVRPGLGGSVLWAWGPAHEWPTTITGWQPETLLELSETHDEGAVRLATQFHLSPGAAKGETVVRVVASGFGKGQKWADYYDGISHGWRYELLVLKEYLERHLGQEREAFWVNVPTKVDPGALWTRLVAPGVLSREGLPRAASPGGTVRFTTPGGREYSGRVLMFVPGRLLAMVVDELGGGTFRLELEKCSGTPCASVLMSVWDAHRGLAPALREEWRQSVEAAVAEHAPAAR